MTPRLPDHELSGEYRLVLAANSVAVCKGVQRSRVQISLQLLQGCFSSILRLTSVHWLAGQQENAFLAPTQSLQGEAFWKQCQESVGAERCRGGGNSFPPSPTRDGAPWLVAGGPSYSSKWS